MLELNLSRVMLGTAQWGMSYGIANRHGLPSYEEVREMLAVAHDNGVNCLDTAPSYGESEEVIGRALAELKLAGRMIVVTKVRHLPDPALSERAVDELVQQSVEASLRKLRLGALSVCLLHREQDFRYIDSLLKLKEKGLALHVGCSVTDPLPSRAILDSGLVEAIQVPTNLLDHRFVRDGLCQRAHLRGVALFARSVYLQGLLLMADSKVPPGLAAVLPVKRTLESLAAECGMRLGEFALRYALSLDGIKSVVVGAETPGQLRQNLAYAARGPLDSDVMSRVDQVVPALPDLLLKPGLWPVIADHAVNQDVRI